MQRGSEPKLRRMQSTIRYGQDALTSEEARQLGVNDLHYRYYTSMLIDDIALWAVPPSLARGERCGVVLEPADSTAEALVTRGLDRDRGNYRSDLGDVMYQFLNNCARTIAGYGLAPYEIVYLSPPDEEKVVGFELFSIFPPTLRPQGGKLIQYVPQRFSEGGKYPPLIEVDPNRVAFFTLPDALREDLGRAIYALSGIDHSRGLDLAMQITTGKVQGLNYNFQTHQHAKHLAVAEATRNIGWDARGTFRSEQLEFHTIYRQLLFQQFVIRVREAILKKLNEVLKAVGDVITPLGQLRLTGLPTSENADESLRHLDAGDRSFKELIDPFLIC